MANNIEIPSCVNYTDLRQKNEDLSVIEVETIQNYVNSLSPEGKKVLLEQISDDDLIWEINWRLITRKGSLVRGEQGMKGWR